MQPFCLWLTEAVVLSAGFLLFRDGRRRSFPGPILHPVLTLRRTFVRCILVTCCADAPLLFRCVHFPQIATLNFLDAFLRTRSQVVAPSDAFTAVELWMGVVHVYTCQDSLSTCQVRTVARAQDPPPPGSRCENYLFKISDQSFKNKQ